ncbi:hypothetical protein EVAR_65163_1 [Eumeta japonica]|uniref:Uncharacterized protein n=1 Tax=Eumeta variegata TaxID=151549 RepID=A0A4C1ZKC2_EUMVA|nr:hypothetical protein EVAR_65163_1 [Eumeta japonica]
MKYGQLEIITLSRHYGDDRETDSAALPVFLNKPTRLRGGVFIEAGVPLDRSGPGLRTAIFVSRYPGPVISPPGPGRPPLAVFAQTSIELCIETFTPFPPERAPPISGAAFFTISPDFHTRRPRSPANAPDAICTWSIITLRSRTACDADADAVENLYVGEFIIGHFNGIPIGDRAQPFPHSSRPVKRDFYTRPIDGAATSNSRNGGGNYVKCHIRRVASRRLHFLLQ